MNDQLQQALLSILNSTTSAVSAGVNFLQAELPDVIRQLLLWHAVQSFMWFMIGIVATLACIIVARKFFVLLGRDWNQPECVFIPGIFVILSLAIVSGTLHQLTWLQIWLVPKIFLIEYAAKLVTK